GVRWNRGTTEDRAVEAEVAAALRKELTADDAVKIALLNNRALQATYEELGIAQADLVQAGLLKNPIFGASLRFPDRAPRGPNVELSVTEDFLELLLIPARKRLAAAQFEAAKLRVADAVIRLAADVRAAFYRLEGTTQII